MSIIESLLSNAYQDTQLLIKNDSLGDDFSISRDVDFVLIASEKAKAEVVSSFINDNCYGTARFEQVDSGFRIVTTLNMPITQHVLCAVSALMACLGHLFSVEYDGWGSALQKRPQER